ncbi:hypothetical protein MHOL44478_15125 [Mycobacterium holsaticum DSM 44478]|nr:hypothetical protein [Mycolicibacterium holsaticum DSM 44478 = JCM 12374]
MRRRLVAHRRQHRGMPVIGGDRAGAVGRGRVLRWAMAPRAVGPSGFGLAHTISPVSLADIVD